MLRVRGLQVALALVVAGGATEATAQKNEPTAQKKSPGTMQLFGALPRGAVSGEILGMRPGTAGAIARVQLSLAGTSSLQSRAGTPRRLEIALPDGKSVTCLLRPVARPQAMTVFVGTAVGGGEGARCNLVVEGGQVTGEVDLESGSYRIQPIGVGATHAVIEIKTENLPNELGPKLPPPEPSPQRAAADTEPCDV